MTAIPNPVPWQKSGSDALVSQESKNEHKENKNKANLPTTQNIENSSEASKQNADQTSEIKQIHVIIDNTPQKNGWQEISAITNIGLALIAALTLGAIWYQARETATAAKASSVAAKATQDSVIEIQRQADTMARQLNIAIEKERPKISAEVELPTIDTELLSLVPMKIECWCPTPAFIEEAEVMAYVNESDKMPWIPTYMPLDLPKQIRQTITLERSAIIFDAEHAASVDKQKIRDKKQIIYIRGFIKYRGVHLLPGAESYRTKFSFTWVPVHAEWLDLPGFEDSGYWFSNEEENETT
jgi:hypothetical protein